MITNFYWMSSLLYGLALTGVLIHDLIIRKNPDKGEAAYRKLIFTVILFCLQDTFWGLCGSGIIANDSVFWLASTIFHSSTVLTTYIWLEYIMTFLGDKVAHSNRYMLFGKFVVCLQACLLIRNVYTPTVFHIENGVYYTDFLRPLAFADQYVVFFVMFVISILVALKETGEVRRRYFAIVAFAGFPVILGAFQLKYPDDPYYSIGYAFSCFIIHMFIIATDREKLLIWQRDFEKKEGERRVQEERSYAITDQLTGLLNRRAYEEDFAVWTKTALPDDLIYVAADVNGLKDINDEKGHVAGDELIIGAGKCLTKIFADYGKVYRTGGDEYVAIIRADKECLNKIKGDMDSVVNSWQGELVESLSISFGMVQVTEYPELSLTKIAQIADKRMYQSKNAFYIAKGVDRRHQRMAYKALCSSYTKILKINLTEDNSFIVYADNKELNKANGYSSSITIWLRDFALTGNVHPDDIESYLENTGGDYLKQYFASGMKSKSIHYRRLTDGNFRHVKMEIITAEDYSNESQSLYLFVKDIE